MKQDDMQALWANSHLSGGSQAYVDGLYESYLDDPSSVPENWRVFFETLPRVEGAAMEVSHKAIREEFARQAMHGGFSASITKSGSATLMQEIRLSNVMQLINAYRLHGHHQACLNPLTYRPRKEVPDLSLSYHGLTEKDLDIPFNTRTPLAPEPTPLREIVERLNKTYCGSIGIEYMHITNNEETLWIQKRIEGIQSTPTYTAEDKKSILQQLTAAEGLEKYLGSRYVGQKRFSLEGGDSLIPLLYETIQQAGVAKVKEVIIGMAHRGRLNVLINILGKSPAKLFEEFEGGLGENEERSGDVKYHMGFSSDVNTQSGVVHLALAFNPSHLEIISPVVEGSVRARQRRRHDLGEKKTVVPVIIHGDAAFAGQGVVMETFNFSQARGYATGGTVHIVINNQIGFTTSSPLDARSTLYCTDVAKMVQAPILHVNGNDPEAVVLAARLAFDFRMTFKKDVVIDLVCYRRHGHNEADEPSITQPIMYRAIRQLPTTRAIYEEQLVKEGVITPEVAESFVADYRNKLEEGHALVETVTGTHDDKFAVDWERYLDAKWDESIDTGVDNDILHKLAKRLETLPKGLTLHPVVKRLLQERHKMTEGEIPCNWGYAETLAYASLVYEKHPVRLSGQDSGRGTFAHRHAVIHDYETGESYIPLQYVSKDQETFLVIDSILSEEAVLGFEYGYSASEPNALILWEAQFGDFANGAQVVIDQFISSGEQKWDRLSGLTMLLPHGFEGMGPEHSSARLERYLQLCAQNNMQVCVPTTPAQIFHLLRRQVKRPYRKPLIIMTPKSLLRHKLAVSSFEDMTKGQYQVVIPEIDKQDKAKVRKVILCSGKVYYDLLEARRKKEIDDIAIFRIEQLYPFPEKVLTKLLKSYKNVKDIVWCQEEPKNQGAWFSSRHHIEACLQSEHVVHYVGRDFFAAPAVGDSKLHIKQQHQLVAEALT